MLEADIILHVRDISHEDADAQERDVEGVLLQLGIDLQWLTPHLASLGAVEVSREEYLERLAEAIQSR